MTSRLSINDSGTWRRARKVHVNDSGTWRSLKAVYVNDAGTWRRAFSRSQTFTIHAGTSLFTSAGYDIFTPAGTISSGGVFDDSSGITCVEVVDFTAGDLGGTQAFYLGLTGFSSTPSAIFIESVSINGHLYLQPAATFFSNFNGISYDGEWRWIGQDAGLVSGNDYDVEITLS